MRTGLVLGVALAALAACGGEKPKADDGLLINQQSSEALPQLNPDPARNTFAPALGVDLTKFRKTPSGLYVRDDAVGTGATAAVGKPAKVHYTGYLANGKVFDSSEGKDPFPITPGETPVIDAWTEAVPGMRVGGVRTIVVPAALGYGAAGAGPDIPPNAVLVFRMRLAETR